MCQPRRVGGLGVRDVRWVNLSLLAKWRWRLLQNGEGLWKDVLIEKYGIRVSNLLIAQGGTWPRFMSKWWKDIAQLEDNGGISWFNSEVVRKVGVGNSTSFWKDPWRGATPFCRKYPRLFAISNNKEATVEEVRQGNGATLEWDFRWRRALFVWEEELLISLMEDLESHSWENHEDRWGWMPEVDGVFSVKSCYLKLESLWMGEEGWGTEEKRVFEGIWKSKAPLKVVAFSWKLLLDRIPTRSNLARRNCLPSEVPNVCVLCSGSEEMTNHLFLHCLLRLMCGQML